MRRRITLYIGSQLADLADDALVLFSYTRTELNNPSAVKNTYSKKITLPGTQQNCRIFGHYERLDRRTVGGSGRDDTGTKFTAIHRTPFRIYDEMSRCLESGYVKLESIAEDCHGVRSFDVTLFGGMGSFLYGLMYKGDGTLRSLANIYLRPGDTGGYPETEFQINPSSADVKAGWTWLKTHPLGAISAGTSQYEIINFAPCYNGLPPSEFDAQRAIMPCDDAQYNLPAQQGYEGLRVGNKRLCLVSFAQKHTEWHMRELRAYLQRPIVRLRAIIDAITIQENNGGYDVTLDPGFFNSDNPYYNDTWLTMPMMPVHTGPTVPSYLKGDFFGTGMTPADVLVSFAKAFGLIIDVDEVNKRVKISQRANFFYNAAAPIDATDRIDTTSVTSQPYSFTKRIIRFAHQQYGLFAEQYAAKYGRTYGGFDVDTGTEWEDTVEDTLAGSVFRGAPEALETSKYFCYYYLSYGAPDLPSAFIDPGAKYRLFAIGSQDIKDFDVPALPNNVIRTYYGNTPYLDDLPKLQLHGEDENAQTGEGVLVFYRGTFTPSRNIWSLTDNTAEMLQLNNGGPCWDPLAKLYRPAVALDELPVFSRYFVLDGNTLYKGLDFGVPREVALPGMQIAAGSGVYHQYWQRYIEDRCDVDSRVVRCKMDLRGLDVGNGLLARPVFWRNSVWVINKIEDYSLTTYDFAKVELIKVKDLWNYKSL